MDYTLKIKCLSAVSPASGETWGGFIDNDIVYDEFGLPYIPAKRVKGILLENAIDVVKALDGKNTFFDFSDETIYKLFGMLGTENSAPLTIDNAYLDDYIAIREWLKWAKVAAPEFVTTDQIISLYTHTRAKTAIENNLAQEHTLRIDRILNRGITFYSTINLDNNPENKYLYLLTLSAMVSRRLGLNRNRGLGLVKMSIEDQNGNAVFNEQAYRKIFSNGGKL